MHLNLKQLALGVGLSMSALTLVACSNASTNANPLMKATKQSAAHFLVAASRQAESALHLPVTGRAYQACRTEESPSFNCSTLYAGMVAYAKTTQQFKTVTVNNLKSQALWQRIKSRYQDAAFDWVS